MSSWRTISDLYWVFFFS